MTIYNALLTAAPLLEAQFKESTIINHSASKGAFREFILKEIIRPYLPFQYGLSSGECFDINGKSSRQLDIVVFDQLFSYSIPRGNYRLVPFESAYGEIEVKSKLNEQTFNESIENIESFKSLVRHSPEPCQVLPTLSIDIKGVNWETAAFTTPFGCIFAYDSVKPDTIMDYILKKGPLNPAVMPDMIVLFKEKTIIMRIIYERDKFYVTTDNCYQGFVSLPCGENTLPIFLSYLMCRTRDTRIKATKIDDILNSIVDKQLREMGTQRVVKFSSQYNGIK